MSHAALLAFMSGSIFIFVSTLPRVVAFGESASFTRCAAVLFLLGSLMLW